MALGRGHDLFNLLALPACLYYMPKEFYIPFTAGYLFGTFLLSPDLDLPNSKPAKRWKAFRHLWKPYQKASRHRGLSHIPVLGSFTRIAYFLTVLIFLYFVLLGLSAKYAPALKELLLAFDPFETLSRLAQREEVFYFSLGVVASEVFHVFIDLLTSLLKRFKILAK
jgi:uncharacterized metal-binding protein